MNGDKRERNIKLTIAYDGSRYDGWQKQGNTSNTIQQKLENLLTTLLEEPIEIHGSGRTDAGVHALGQVANFHTTSNMSLEQLHQGMCEYLPKDIGILSVEEVDLRFHSRLNAKGKKYQYRIWNSRISNVFERKYMYQVPENLNMNTMLEASKQLVGTHDFISFCSNKRMKKSSVRTIYHIDIEKLGDEIRITYVGNGFLYNMVRILTGTLIEVGLGTRKPETIPSILAEKSREAAGVTAPAQGLSLVDVYYEEDFYKAK